MPNLKIGPDNFTGGSGRDNYFAQVKVSGGTRLNTLETGDRIDGRSNFDTLDAQLSSEGGSYFVRPTLISVEKARFSVNDNDGEGVTVNLNQSEDLKTIVNYQSLGDLTLTNVDDVQKFFWKNGDSNDFEVNDLSSDYYSFEITNTGPDSGDFAYLSIYGDEAIRSTFILEDAFVDIYAANYVNVARLTVSNSQVDLDIDTDKISFESLNSVNGEFTSNSVHFDYDSDTTFDRFVVTGDAFISFSADESNINVNKMFDASGNSGGVSFNANLNGNFQTLLGSTDYDYYQNINSYRHGTVNLDFMGGYLNTGTISSSDARHFTVTTGTAFGENAYISGITSSSGRTNATVDVVGGSGGEKIGGYGNSQRTGVYENGPGLSITGSAAADVDLGAGRDVLRVTTLNSSVANSIDMGNGSDVLSVSDAAGLNFNSEGGTVAVTTLDGGAGFDTLIAELGGFASGSGTDTVANNLGQIVNFERLVLADYSHGTYDMTALPDVEIVQLGQGGFSGTDSDGGGDYEFLNVNAGTTFIVAEAVQTSSYEDGSGNDSVSTFSPDPVDLTLRADTGVTETTVQMGEMDGINNGYSNTYNADVHVDGFTTLNVVSEGPHTTDSADGEETYNVIGLTDETLLVDTLTTINISGPENLAIDIHGDAVTTVDASALSGDLDLTSSTFTQSVDITGGSGDDILVGSEEADMFDLGQGGEDLILFASADDSDLGIGQSDTVSSFDGGTTLISGDKFVFNSLEFGDGNPNKADTIDGINFTRAYTLDEADSASASGDDLLVFLGNANTFAQAQAAVATNDTGIQHDGNEYNGAVYDRSTNTLYIDVDSDGDLDSDDFALQLDAGVTSINARDLITTDFSAF